MPRHDNDAGSQSGSKSAKRSLKEIEKEVLPRIEDARTDRAHIEPFINHVFRYADPGRRRMGERQVTTATDRGQGQHRIYDSELQFDMRECASEMKQIHTPNNDDWADLAAKKALPDEVAKNPEFEDLRGAEQDKLFEAIRQTRLDTALDDAWWDWQITAGCVEISKGRPGRPALVEWVPLPELYMEACSELPTGIDGRWRRQDVKRRYLKMRYPMVDWDEYLKTKRKLSGTGSETHEVTYGYRYDADKWPAERWFLDVLCDDELVYSKALTGPGEVGLIPFRAGENAPSPWGRGPASIALSPARALDQLAYIAMKALPKRVDPVVMHSGMGDHNTKLDIRAGDWVPMGPEFRAEVVESRQPLNDFYEEVAQLRFMVKRALWQDRPDPYEAGTTPPTAFQIQQQELGRAIRQERPRARVNRELIVPVMERIIRLETRAKRMAPIRLDGRDPIVVEPRSPLSRAADLEDVQQAQVVLGIMQSYFAERGAAAIDVMSTITNIKNKLKDRIVELQDPDQGVVDTASEAAAQSAGAVAGERMGADLAAA